MNDIGVEIDEALELSNILSEEEIDSLHISVWDIYAQSRFDDDERKMTQRVAEVVENSERRRQARNLKDDRVSGECRFHHKNDLQS